MSLFISSDGSMSDKWKPLILFYKSEKTLRFGELRRCIPEITQKMLTAQFRELEVDSMIHRKIYQRVPPKRNIRYRSMAKETQGRRKKLIKNKKKF